MVYCVRSFVPMLANAARARIGPACSAALGTSTMTPAVIRPCAWQLATNFSVSATVATIGAMTHTSALSAAAACAIAVSWSSSTSGLRVEVRSPRTPSAGFGSSPKVRNGSGLSAPASSVRTTTFLPLNAARTCRYCATCSAMVGAVVWSRKQNSVRNSPTPSAPASAAACAPAGAPMLASSATLCPSLVRPAPSNVRTRAASSAARAICSAVGSIVTDPAVPSTSTSAPALSAVAPVAPTTAGMPSERAMIAVCDVGPPSLVMIATTCAGSSVAVSTGARSVASSTNGCPGFGTPGAGRSVRTATMRLRTSATSPVRSAM